MILIPSLIIKKWFTWSAFYRYSLLCLGLGVSLLGPIPVMLEFMRYEGAGVVSVTFMLGATLFGIELRSLVPSVGNPIWNALQKLSQLLKNKWRIIFGRY
jgi:hypothetical protein